MKMNVKTFILALVLIAALGLSALPALADSYVYVTGDANIRSGPGLGYGQLGVMYDGETASYLGSASVDERGVAWYKIQYGTITGWVSSRYAVLSSGGASSGGSYVAVSGGNANVRSGPGLDYTALTVMYSGDTAAYLDSTSVDERGVAWYKVSFDGVTGWVSSRYAKLHTGTSSGGSGSGYVVVSGGDANLRSGPGLGYGQVGVMYDGDSASYMDSTSVDERGVAWYKVKFGSVVGWVSSRYAKLY